MNIQVWGATFYNLVVCIIRSFHIHLLWVGVVLYDIVHDVMTIDPCEQHTAKVYYMYVCNMNGVEKAASIQSISQHDLCRITLQIVHLYIVH